MKAIVIGGSGATGKELIKQLLENKSFSEVISLVRKKSAINHPKLKEVIVAFNKLSDYKNEIVGDVAFSCLGTTLKIAGSKENQWQVDYEYQLKFAKIAKENGVNSFVLVSSLGADKHSKFFYTKMKGLLEDEILNLDFAQTLIFQPPSLIRPNTDRKGEILSIKLIRIFNRLGFFKNYEPLHVSDLASVMIQTVLNFKPEKNVLKPIDIKTRIS